MTTYEKKFLITQSSLIQYKMWVSLQFNLMLIYALTSNRIPNMEDWLFSPSNFSSLHREHRIKIEILEETVEGDKKQSGIKYSIVIEYTKYISHKCDKLIKNYTSGDKGVVPSYSKHINLQSWRNSLQGNLWW